MNRSYKTVTNTPQRTTRNTYAATPAVVNIPQQPQPVPVVQQPNIVIQPTKIETPNVAQPMITEEHVKIVKFQAKNKVSAKVKRQRANRRLRRLLCPKTAVMALHELFNKENAGEELDIQISTEPMSNRFKAEVKYQGKVYAGLGLSKQAARNAVAEKVLRDMVIEKMKKCPKKALPEPNASSDVEMADANEEDEVPMTHLASYALHKLFSEWADEGFEVPDFKSLFSGSEANVAKETSVPAPRTELPPNASFLHPAMLLAQMRPGIQYQDLGFQGTTPNVIHCMGVTVDGKKFIGNGKSKKVARREAAQFACQEIFNVVFDPSVLNGK